MAVARQRIVAIELAETAAELDVLLAGDLLPAQQQHAMVQEGAIDAAELGFGQRPVQVDADHLGAERKGKRTRFNGHAGSSGGCGRLAAGSSCGKSLPVNSTFKHPCERLSATASRTRASRQPIHTST